MVAVGGWVCGGTGRQDASASARVTFVASPPVAVVFPFLSASAPLQADPADPSAAVALPSQISTPTPCGFCRPGAYLRRQHRDQEELRLKRLVNKEGLCSKSTKLITLNPYFSACTFQGSPRTFPRGFGFRLKGGVEEKMAEEEGTGEALREGGKLKEEMRNLAREDKWKRRY